MTPDSAKSMGLSEPVLLVLAALCWMAMLVTMVSWIGKTPTPGRETDRVVLQAYSGGAAVLLWIFLAALLLVGTSKEVIPDAVGGIAWIAMPLSCLAGLAAIGVLYDPPRRWPMIIPVVLPLLVGGYVVYSYFPSVKTVSISTAGLVLWGAVAAVSLSILPTGATFLEAQGHRSIRAEPGPELDRWKTNEQDRAKKDGLDQLSKMDEETKLYEVKVYLRPASLVRQEAIEFARHLPDRQSDMIQMLLNRDDEVLSFIADIDLQPTPELCNAARGWLHSAVVQRRQMFHSGPESFVGMEFEEGLPGIAWISANCGCEKELDEIEAYARAQNTEAPAVKKFLDGLETIRAKK